MKFYKYLYFFFFLSCQTFTFGQLFNVVDYGAIPNDNKDDSKAIQNCINQASKKGGGTVFFPKGNYVVSRTPIKGKAWCLFAQSNVGIVGESKDNTTITLANKQLNYTRILQIENVENVKINDLTFDGNLINQNNPTDPNEHLGAVFINSSKNVTITNSHFVNTGGDGVGVRGVKVSSKNVKIENCLFANNQRNGITLGSGFDGVIISNCIFQDNIDDSPIDTEPSGGVCENVVIENNKFYTPTLLTLGGPKDDNTGKNFYVRNNIFQNCRVMMINAENVYFENNQMTVDTKKGIIFKLINYNKNINIRNNIIEGVDNELLYAVATQNSNKLLEEINFTYNKVNLSGNDMKVFHLRGSNKVFIKNNEINIAEGKDNTPLLVAANYPMQQIVFSDNQLNGFSKPITIYSIKNNLINGLEITNNSLKYEGKTISQPINIPKTSREQIKNIYFNNNKLIRAN